MVRKARKEMIEETKGKLLEAAREAFGTIGYANTSMDELTASVGLTRGALYHHFGDKKGLLAAVVDEIDQEMDNRLHDISNAAATSWEGFVGRCRAYIEMAIEPEIQRIVLRDAPSVLGNGFTHPSQSQCLATMATMLQQFMDEGIIAVTDSHALARMLNGGLMNAAFWLANSQDAEKELAVALHSLGVVLDGLRMKSK
ncbi:TetR/AcrR family transcriptional regulator [Paenibacillus sp. MER 180]|uniref:TetR/AcrR family transcriptional regulator n=1 Tax=Paenibacillus popilliae TaxID=78057 RepID=A0ABY3AVG9_PAEPP|nr:MULTISPECIES: TetR/AcrR family transcriptional regulator [unclassified Paenibacillus]MCM3290384.1 TetR/AcrR family transcriptional regulator [Paenibacillus sp. MER 180]OBY78493.1 TetR family transcriptional regulator [Paenibacillus sp. KS1]TQR44593.1 TetR/AcrR family transcriptional regulator [Paenibacillus sp. SDF0028]